MIEIKGLTELASKFPDDDWRELRILVRKQSEGAEVRIVQELTVLGHLHEIDGHLYRVDDNDELQPVT